MHCTCLLNPGFRKYRGRSLAVCYRENLESGENVSPFQRHIKIVEVEMYGAAICHTEEKIVLLPLKNGSRISGVTYSLCLKPYMGLGLPSGTCQQVQQQL